MLQKNMKKIFFCHLLGEIFFDTRSDKNNFFPFALSIFFYEKDKKTLLEENQIMKVFCMYLENLLESLVKLLLFKNDRFPSNNTKKYFF